MADRGTPNPAEIDAMVNALPSEWAVELLPSELMVRVRAALDAYRQEQKERAGFEAGSLAVWAQRSNEELPAAVAVPGTTETSLPASSDLSSTQSEIDPQPEPLTREIATDAQWEAIVNNRPLCDAVSLRLGGLAGDWVNEGAIPNLPPFGLRALTVDGWLAWRAQRRAAAVDPSPPEPDQWADESGPAQWPSGPGARRWLPLRGRTES